MELHLSHDDLCQMPSNLHADLLHWLKIQKSQPDQVPAVQAPKAPRVSPQQLSLNLEERKVERKTENFRVRLTDLYDAGITKRNMEVKVKLKTNIAKVRGCKYINGLHISGKGTIFYKDKEFDLPSPIAEEVNGSSANGWEYVEVKKDGKWITLGNLRKIWRRSHE